MPYFYSSNNAFSKIHSVCTDLNTASLHVFEPSSAMSNVQEERHAGYVQN